MTLNELTGQEQLVLTALVKHIIRSDGQLTDDEIDAMSDVAEEMGEDRWQTAFRKLRGQYKETDELLRLAETVQRQEAREQIHAVISKVAASDSISPEEKAVLDAVASIWDID